MSSVSNDQPYDGMIYNQYLSLCQYIDRLVNQLDTKYGASSDPQYLKERAELVALKQDPANFYSAYQKDYGLAHGGTQSQGEKAWEDFQSVFAQITQQADAIVNGGDPAGQIQQDADAAQQIESGINTQIESDTTALAALLQKYQDWQAILAALGPMAKDPQSQKDYQAALEQLEAIGGEISDLKSDLATLQGLQQSVQQQIGQFADLLKNPSIENAQKADDLLEAIKGIQANVSQAQSDFDQKTPTADLIAKLLAAIATLQTDLDPSEKEIASDAQAAKDLLDQIDARIGQDSQALDAIAKQYAALQAELQKDQAAIDAITDPKLKAQAQAALNLASQQLAVFQSAMQTLQSDLTSLQGLQEQAQADLVTLNGLTHSPDPSKVVGQADGLLKEIQGFSASFDATQADFTKQLPTDAEVKAIHDAFAAAEQLIPPTPPVTVNGQSAYIDMGYFYSYITSNCIQWWPEPVQIIQSKVDAFLKTIFDALKKDGVTNIELSFAQLSDIDALLNGTTGSRTDTITQIFKNGYPVGNTGKNFLKYFVDAAHANGTKVDLSFGGSIATANDMKIQGDPATQAERLKEFMDQYGIDSVDWDIEGSDVLYLMQQNTAADVQTFFSTLHNLLAAENKQSIITLAGSIQDGPAGSLNPLFQNFDRYFDGVNLMLYSNSQYYLDADNDTWGLKQWLSYIKDPSKIHIGFYDSIPYENQGASAGTQYDIPPGLTRGQTAAWIYEHVLQQLGLTPDQMGAPFWWTDQPVNLPTDQTIQDFWNALSPQNPAQQDLAKAQPIVSGIDTGITNDQTAISSLKTQIDAWNRTIQNLEDQVAKISPPNPQINADLKAAQTARDAIVAAFTAANNDLTALTGLKTQADAALASLQTLAQSADPSKEKADQLLAAIQGYQLAVQNNPIAADLPTSTQVQTLSAAIQKVQTDIDPTPPPSTSSKFEEYYETWDPNVVHTSLDPVTGKTIYSFDLPKGVDILDVSFGKYDPATGTIDGLNWSPEEIQAFVNQAHAAGIALKIAIGGATYPFGTVDPDKFSSAIQSFVHQYQFDGVDFDWEDLGANASLIGDLIHETREKLGPEALLSMTVEPPADATMRFYKPIFDKAFNDLTNINLMGYSAFPGYNPQYDIEGGTDPATGIYYGDGWLKGSGVDPDAFFKKISLGFFPDPNGGGAPVTDSDYVAKWTDWAKEKGLNVFLWDYNDDHAGNTDAPSGGSKEDYFTDEIDRILHGGNDSNADLSVNDLKNELAARERWSRLADRA